MGSSTDFRALARAYFETDEASRVASREGHPSADLYLAVDKAKKALFDAAVTRRGASAPVVEWALAKAAVSGLILRHWEMKRQGQKPDTSVEAFDLAFERLEGAELRMRAWAYASEMTDEQADEQSEQEES